MSRYLKIVICFILTLIIVNSSLAEQYRIYFADKGEEEVDATRVLEAASKISDKAIARRLRNGYSVPVDPWDIAPASVYLSEVTKITGGEVISVSPWLNSVTISVSDSMAMNISDVKSLPFVYDITKIAKKESALAPDNTGYSMPDTRHPYYGYAYDQILLSQLPALNDEGYTGNGITIAVLDSGFDLEANHCFDQLDVLGAREFTSQGDVNLDLSGHGSKVLSVMGGYAPGWLVGPCPDATYILAKTEDTRGDYDHPYEEDFWIEGVTWAENLGADILTSSLGYDEFAPGTGYTYEQMDGETTLVTRAANIAVAKGLYVNTSAGNDGEDHMSAPADGFRVAAIGNVRPDGTVSGSSSRGPTYDGRIKPEYAAQGTKVYCALVNNPNQDFAYFAGTSAAAPIAASAAALVLEKNPDFTADDIRIALSKTATAADNPDNDWGFGIVQGYDAANFDPSGIVDAEKPTISFAHSGTYLSGTKTPYNFNVSVADPDGISYWQIALTTAGNPTDIVYLRYGTGAYNGIIEWGGLDYYRNTITTGTYDTYLTAWDRMGYVKSISGGTLTVNEGTESVENVFAFPNPFLPGQPHRHRSLSLANVPANSDISIYTVSGDLVKSVKNTTGGTVGLRPSDGDWASGVYLFHIDAGAEGSYTGKFAVIK